MDRLMGEPCTSTCPVTRTGVPEGRRFDMVSISVDLPAIIPAGFRLAAVVALDVLNNPAVGLPSSPAVGQHELATTLHSLEGGGIKGNVGWGSYRLRTGP